MEPLICLAYRVQGASTWAGDVAGAEFDIEALKVFRAVVEAGSFSAAAKRLGRAQSTVSYIVRELEAKLGTALLDRSGYRPRLTDAGGLLLPRIELLLRDAAVLAAAVDAVAGGVEPELVLVVDSLFPVDALTAPLAAFATEYPQVRLRILVETMSSAVDAMHDGLADLGVLIAVDERLEGLEPQTILPIELVPVAAPDHPLAAAAERASTLDRRAAREHLQLVLTDRTDRTDVHDKGVHSSRTWRLTDPATKRALILAGAGWGSLPRHLVADDLAAGRLRALAFAGWDGYDGPPTLSSVVVHRRDRPLGPAGAWLRQLIADSRA